MVLYQVQSQKPQKYLSSRKFVRFFFFSKWDRSFANNVDPASNSWSKLTFFCYLQFLIRKCWQTHCYQHGRKCIKCPSLRNSGNHVIRKHWKFKPVLTLWKNRWISVRSRLNWQRGNIQSQGNTSMMFGLWSTVLGTRGARQLFANVHM